MFPSESKYYLITHRRMHLYTRHWSCFGGQYLISWKTSFRYDKPRLKQAPVVPTKVMYSAQALQTQYHHYIRRLFSPRFAWPYTAYWAICKASGWSEPGPACRTRDMIPWIPLMKTVGDGKVQYIPWNMHTVFVLCCYVLSILKHWLAKLILNKNKNTLIAGFMGPTWGPSGADRTQVGPMLAPWTLLSGYACIFQSFSMEGNGRFTRHCWYHGCWWPGDARSQGISTRDIGQVCPASVSGRLAILTTNALDVILIMWDCFYGNGTVARKSHR